VGGHRPLQHRPPACSSPRPRSRRPGLASEDQPRLLETGRPPTQSGPGDSGAPLSLGARDGAGARAVHRTAPLTEVDWPLIRTPHGLFRMGRPPLVRLKAAESSQPSLSASPAEVLRRLVCHINLPAAARTGPEVPSLTVAQGLRQISAIVGGSKSSSKD
jgi:hypothetical protein